MLYPLCRVSFLFTYNENKAFYGYPSYMKRDLLLDLSPWVDHRLTIVFPDSVKT